MGGAGVGVGAGGGGGAGGRGGGASVLQQKRQEVLFSSYIWFHHFVYLEVRVCAGNPVSFDWLSVSLRDARAFASAGESHSL